MKLAYRCRECGTILRRGHLIHTLSSPVHYLHFCSMKCLKKYVAKEEVSE